MFVDVKWSLLLPSLYLSASLLFSLPPYVSSFIYPSVFQYKPLHGNMCKRHLHRRKLQPCAGHVRCGLEGISAVRVQNMSHCSGEAAWVQGRVYLWKGEDKNGFGAEWGAQSKKSVDGRCTEGSRSLSHGQFSSTVMRRTSERRALQIAMVSIRRGGWGSQRQKLGHRQQNLTG